MDKKEMIIELNEKIMKGKKPNIKITKRCWLAGGSIRRWFAGEKQNSDTDVYSLSDEDMTVMIRENNLTQKIFETKNAITYKNHDQIVQFIKLRFENMETTINNFDFKHCQFAYDGKKIVTTAEAIICALRKTLMIHNVIKGYEIDTLRRAFKYQRQGYSICMGTLRDLARKLTSVSEEEIDKQIEISPGGGKRILRFD